MDIVTVGRTLQIGGINTYVRIAKGNARLEEHYKLK